MADWDIKKSSYVYKNPWLKVRRDDTEVKGEVYDYYIVELKDDVVVGALTEKDEMLFVKMYRTGVQEVMLELPAGYREKGKSFKESALSELEEETGHCAKSIEEIGVIYRSPARLTQKTHIFLAKDLEWVGQNLEIDEEEIEIVPIKLDKAVSMIRKNEIKDTTTIAAVMMIRDRL